jgi:hypothetical protein
MKLNQEWNLTRYDPWKKLQTPVHDLYRIIPLTLTGLLMEGEGRSKMSLHLRKHLIVGKALDPTLEATRFQDLYRDAIQLVTPIAMNIGRPLQDSDITSLGTKSRHQISIISRNATPMIWRKLRGNDQ